MELKVGMYCFCEQRRNLGIGKIFNISKMGNVFVKFKNYIEPFVSSNLEASENIIDLIKIGDYVNGMEVIAKDSDNRLYVPEDLGQPYDREFSNGCFEYTLLDKNFEIKSVVTKEQFDSMKYEVGE